MPGRPGVRKFLGVLGKDRFIVAIHLPMWFEEDGTLIGNVACPVLSQKLQRRLDSGVKELTNQSNLRKRPDGTFEAYWSAIFSDGSHWETTEAWVDPRPWKTMRQGRGRLFSLGSGRVGPVG